MSNDSHSDMLKGVLQKLNLVCDKLLHLGRELGGKILELPEVETDGIKRMGNWNLVVFDTFEANSEASGVYKSTISWLFRGGTSCKTCC
jgi:hypothetical protein